MAGNNSTAAIMDSVSRSKIQVGFEVFFAIVICVVSILGNSLVVLVVRKDSRLRRSITNSFIHNLAWTDICMAALAMPLWIISLYNGRWIFSTELCELSAAVLFILALASILSMGAIAVNRYLKVVKPNLYQTFFPNKKIARVYCVAVWLVAVALSSPPLYGWGKFAYHPSFALCSLVWSIGPLSYVIIYVGIAVNGVTCVIFYCYYKIYRTVKASSTNMASHAAENNVSSTTVNNMCQATDIKMLKTTFTVVCVYVLCWTPVSLVVLWETVFGAPPRIVSSVAVYLEYLSSGVNPVIYGLMNPQFKRAFAKVLKGKTSEEDQNAGQNVGAHNSRSIPDATVQPRAVNRI